MSEKQAKAERQETRFRTTEMVCRHCAFYVALDEKLGTCHRWPPTPVISMAPDGQVAVPGSAAPPVTATYWCGEWQKGSMVKVAREIPKGSVIDFKNQNGSHN